MCSLYQLLADVLLAAQLLRLTYLFKVSLCFGRYRFVLCLAVFLFILGLEYQRCLTNFLDQQYPRVEAAEATVLKPHIRIKTCWKHYRGICRNAVTGYSCGIIHFKTGKEYVVICCGIFILGFNLKVIKLCVDYRICLAEATSSAKESVVPERVLPRISALDVIVRPLTRVKQQHSQDKFTLNVEDS